MTRLIELDPADYRWLAPTDKCYHYGEYTSNGGFKASETNRWIRNLKKLPTCPANELYWKGQAIIYWGDLLRRLINLDQCGDVTFVPIPGSKPFGHPDYDVRVLRTLQQMAQGRNDIDIRPLLVQGALRESQHIGGRKTPDELLETLVLDPAQLAVPVRGSICVVDDVITQGASFAAAKRLLSRLPNVRQVFGVFFAKTIWVRDFSDYFEDET
jgi:hypothetical protein